MKTTITLALALALSGCASLDFSNRVTTTVACDRALIVSWWAKFGIATDVAAADQRALLKVCKPA